MPIYQFKSPEGKTYEVEGPEGSTKEQAFGILQQKLGGQQPQAPEAPTETPEERMARLTAQAAEERIDPTEGMSTFEKVAAGAGKNAMGIVRGGRQLFNMLTGDTEELAQLQAEEEEARRLDAPLMGTKAGKAGYYGTELASWLLPATKAAKIPGVARMGRAGLMGVEAGLGGLQGAMQATTADESKLTNAALGATLGAVLPVGSAGARKLVRKITDADATEKAARETASRLATETRRVEAHNTRVDTQVANLARKQAADEYKGRQKDLLRRVGKGIGNVVEGQRIAVPKAKVDALRSVQRRYGEDLPPEFTKLIDDMDLASKHGFGKGEILQQAKAALGDRARGNAKRGLPTTGLHEAERIMSDIILSGLPKARAEALRKTYSRYEKVANMKPQLPKPHIPAKKALPVAPPPKKPSTMGAVTRAAMRSALLTEGD